MYVKFNIAIMHQLMSNKFEYFQLWLSKFDLLCVSQNGKHLLNVGGVIKPCISNLRNFQDGLEKAL